MTRHTRKGRKHAHAQLRAISNVLITAPGLGAFTVSVGQLGLQGAVGLCTTRKPTKRLALIWETLGYGVEQLPSAEDVRCLLHGIEAKRRQEVARANDQQQETLFVMAEDMGCSAQDIYQGQKLLKGYGGDIMPRLASGKALGVI